MEGWEGKEGLKEVMNLINVKVLRPVCSEGRSKGVLDLRGAAGSPTSGGGRRSQDLKFQAPNQIPSLSLCPALLLACPLILRGGSSLCSQGNGFRETQTRVMSRARGWGYRGRSAPPQPTAASNDFLV